MREAYASTVTALRRRAIPTLDVRARVRLTKSAAQYQSTRAHRRELPYEAALASGRTGWAPGERVRVYRAAGGRAGLLADPEGDEPAEVGAPDPRDYDAEYYVRVLRDTFASRLVRALTPADFAEVVADPEQPSLFAATLAEARPILTVWLDPLGERPGDAESGAPRGR